MLVEWFLVSGAVSCHVMRCIILVGGRVFVCWVMSCECSWFEVYYISYLVMHIQILDFWIAGQNVNKRCLQMRRDRFNTLTFVVRTKGSMI